ncbi:MAG: hypothetical protein IBX55_13560 [Methyloprofundus sp.]|nr:hypothetical protein [Methyloprofundus sp.]
MSWNSNTLADSLPAVFSAASAAANAAQKELDALNNAIARLQSGLQQAESRAAAVDDLVNSLGGSAADSGIYQLNLTAEQGLWNERILNAAGAPPRDAEAWSAIVCSLVLTADLSAAENAKNTLVDAATKKFDPAPLRIKIPSIQPPAIPAPPDIPEPDPVPDNAWQYVTVGSLFPGTRNAVIDSASGVQAEVDKLNKGIDDLQTKRNEVQAALDEAQGLVNGLAGTGAYSFTAAPELTPTMDWYDRLIDGTELDGRPPFDPSLYSSGSVTVVVATSYAQLLDRYLKLQTALTTPLL